VVATMGLYTFTVEATVPRLTVTEYVGGVILDSQLLFPIVDLLQTGMKKVPFDFS
jgi:hypothetical protein